MSKKWVSGEFKNKLEIIKAIIVHEKDVVDQSGCPVTISYDGMLFLDEYTFTDAYLSDFGYMKEIPWYECIPEWGVLVRNGYIGNIVVKSVDEKGYIQGDYARIQRIHVSDVRLLTNEEIKQFLIEE